MKVVMLVIVIGSFLDFPTDIYSLHSFAQHSNHTVIQPAAADFFS